MNDYVIDDAFSTDECTFYALITTSLQLEFTLFNVCMCVHVICVKNAIKPQPTSMCLCLFRSVSRCTS